MKLKATRFNYHFSDTILDRREKRNAINEDFCDLFYFWILPGEENTMESIFESGKYRKVIFIFSVLSLRLAIASADS